MAVRVAKRVPRGGKRAAIAAPQSVRLPRIAKGRRPEFYEDPAIDQLFAIVTALTGEISVLFDRLDTLERILVERSVLRADALEAYVPDASAAATRGERRDELLRRVFAVLEIYAARTATDRKAGAERKAGPERKAGTQRQAAAARKAATA